MSHVDEGLIHAWLDGAFAPDDPEHARIEAHLLECEACRRAVEVERRIRERATDVLGVAVPDAVRVEPFQRIEAKATAKAKATAGGGVGEAGTAERGKRGRGFRMPMALAATLVLALGATWFARQLMPDSMAAPEMQVMDEANEQDAVANSAVPPAAQPEAPGASARERSEPESEARAAAAPPPSRDQVASAEIVPPSVTTGAQVGTTAVAGRSVEAQAAVPPPAAIDQRNRTPEETRRLGQAMMDSLMRNVGDSALRLEGVVVTGAAASPAQFADADAVIAVDRLGDAGGRVVWTPADPDTVAARFGMRPLGLTGLDADSVQIGLVAGATVARSVYTGDGQPVELLQWVTGSLNAENEQFRQAEPQMERRAAAEGARADAADVAAKAVAPVAPAAYRLEGIDFVLRGTVSADSLVGLAGRVGRVE